jgi:uncharacterized iron-regulated membrane protein
MKPNTLRSLRRYHQYIGMFFAPWILLFSVSGALQTFRLPDPAGAPLWMKWLAAVHKDQGPPRAPRPDRPKGTADTPGAEHRHHDDAPGGAAKRPNPLPLKIFVLLLAIALAGSTLIGVVIGLANRSMRRVSIVLLVLGAVVPPVLLWL